MKQLIFNAVAVTSMLVSLAATGNAAVFLGNIYVSGQDNLFEDQDREAFIDRSPAGDAADDMFGVGDIFIGFSRIDDHTSPAGAFGDLGNRVYTIFSQQVVDVNTTGATHEVIFAPTTVAGLTLSDITGIAGLPAGGFIALFDSPVPLPNDLINVSPGDVDGNGTTNIFDYFADIVANSGPPLQPSAVAGIGNAGGAVATTAGDTPITIAGDLAPLPDHLIARTTPTGSLLITAGGLAGLPGLGSGVTIANFEGGMSVLLNNDAAVTYNRTVAATETGGGLAGIFHDVSLTGGTVHGTSGVVNASEWDNANPNTALSNPGGFATDADFVVNPSVVPEPGSFVIMGTLFLIGLVSACRHSKRAAA